MLQCSKRGHPRRAARSLQTHPRREAFWEDYHATFRRIEQPSPVSAPEAHRGGSTVSALEAGCPHIVSHAVGCGARVFLVRASRGFERLMPFACKVVPWWDTQTHADIAALGM